MQQIIEAMCGLFFAVILVLSGVGIAEAIVDSSEAISFKTEVLVKLEESDYAADVVNQSFNQGEAKGYKMHMSFYSDEGVVFSTTEGNVTEEQMQGITMANVNVTFPFRVDVLKLKKYVTTKGVAH